MVENRAEFEKVEHLEVKVYKQRWFMLVLFCLYVMGSSSQWLQYAIIENIICSYYNVSNVAVNWTSLNFLVTFTLFIFPAMNLVEKYVSII